MFFIRLRNPFLPAAIFFLLGLVYGRTHLLPFLLLLTFFVSLIPLIIVLYRKAYLSLCQSILFAAFFALGLFSSSIEAYPPAENHIKHLINTNPDIFQKEGMELSGIVEAPIDSNERGTFLALSHLCLNTCDGRLKLKGKLRLYMPHPSEGERIIFRPGDRMETFAKLKIPRNFGNPGAFDYRSYLEQEGIFLLGSIKSSKLLTLKKNKCKGWSALMAECRQKIALQIQKLESENKIDKRTANFLLALTIGNREGLTREDKKLLSRGGVYHIVAISGLHVGCIAWLAFLILSYAGCSEKCASLLTVVILFAYLPLSGCRSSAIRAILMISLYLIGRLLRRPSRILTTFSFSLFLYLLIKPKFLYDPGFQLTYAATLSIILFYPMLTKIMSWSGILRSIISLSLSAQIGVIPILAYHFNTILLISFATNILAIPMMMFIIPLSFILIFCLFFFGFPSSILIGILILSTKIIFFMASFYDAVPFLSYRIPDPPHYIIFLYYCSALGLYLFKKIFFKGLSLLFFLLVLMVIAIYPFSPDQEKQLEMTFIDVGQGESAFLVSSNGMSFLIDGGGRWGDRFDAGEMVVSKFLWYRGFKNVDYLILSHLHADHAGGVPSILDNFHVGNIILSEKEKGEKIFSEIEALCKVKGTKIHFVEKGLSYNLEKGKMSLFQVDPINDFESNDSNEHSLITKISYGQIGFLLTGDAPAAIEQAIIQSGRDVKSKILKIGHHGSNDASSQCFLEAVNPEICIISCGADNRWGHPAEQVLERINKIGAKSYRTDRQGAIKILTDGHSYSIKSHLK